jgi:hypothetical protein
MRFLLGIIVGVALTIGGAYVSDSRGVTNARGENTAVGEGAAIERPMVNWDVVGKNWNQLTARVRDEWNRLVG